MMTQLTPFRIGTDQLTSLEILRRVAAARGNYAATVTADQFALLKELESSGFLVGQIGPDSHDSPETMVADVRLMANGRLLMEQMQREQDAANHAKNRSRVSITTAFTNYAAGVLSESYTGGQIIEVTCAWAVDCGVEVPFAQPPIPNGTRGCPKSREP
jgi:hypothetical protein